MLDIAAAWSRSRAQQPRRIAAKPSTTGSLTEVLGFAGVTPFAVLVAARSRVSGWSQAAPCPIERTDFIAPVSTGELVLPC